MEIVFEDNHSKIDNESLREDNINSFITDSIVFDSLNSIMATADKDEATLTDLVFSIAKAKGFDNEEELTAIGTVIADSLEKIGISENLLDEAFNDDDLAIDALADIRSYLLENDISPIEVALDNNMLFDWYCGNSPKPKKKKEGGRLLVTKPSHCTKPDGTKGRYSRVPESGTGKKYKHSNKKLSDKQKAHLTKMQNSNKGNKEASTKRLANRLKTKNTKAKNSKRRV